MNLAQWSTAELKALREQIDTELARREAAPKPASPPTEIVGKGEKSDKPLLGGVAAANNS